MGRLIDALERLEVLDDTLVYYIVGDNGASPEGLINGTFNDAVYQAVLTIPQSTWSAREQNAALRLPLTLAGWPAPRLAR